jgi:CelD/BcsL family acetyltransferase involved in cellulose biosynthesis
MATVQAKTVQVNYRVDPVTKARIEELARQTYRGLGDVVDWVVAEAWERMEQAQRSLVTIEACNGNPLTGAPLTGASADGALGSGDE